MRALLEPRICAVSYLNTVPLVWGFAHGSQRGRYQLSFAIPSECADRLRDGRADIGIVPVVECERQNLRIIPGAGIASDGPVRSILLVSKVPFDRIGSLAADSSSRTSVQLARVILARRFGVDPHLVPANPDLEAMLRECDAALIIGDPALAVDPAALPWRVLDLGAEWTSMTRLPMVFAVWAARQDLDPASYSAADFVASLEEGEKHLDEIVAAESRARHMSEALVREYLTRNVSFRIGPRESAAVDLFLRYVAELELREAPV
ncbi:MAG TPA: menaquinone biosynthesis protein [Bryobacteraceae bacterium]|nr:menaquinone biosynthesis protein [Bryobacteraceae bacterium]